MDSSLWEEVVEYKDVSLHVWSIFQMKSLGRNNKDKYIKIHFKVYWNIVWYIDKMIILVISSFDIWCFSSRWTTTFTALTAKADTENNHLNWTHFVCKPDLHVNNQNQNRAYFLILFRSLIYHQQFKCELCFRIFSKKTIKWCVILYDKPYFQ